MIRAGFTVAGRKIIFKGPSSTRRENLRHTSLAAQRGGEVRARERERERERKRERQREGGTERERQRERESE